MGFEIRNVPYTWPVVEDPQEKQQAEMENLKKRKEKEEESIIPEEWRKVLEDNNKLPLKSVCTLPGAELEIDTGDADPVWVRQYPIPEALREKVTKRVKEWADNGWIVRAPHNCQWNIPLIAASKPSKEGG